MDDKTIAMVKNGFIENVANWSGDLSWKKAMEDYGYQLADITDTDYGFGDAYSGPFLPKEN